MDAESGTSGLGCKRKAVEDISDYSTIGNTVKESVNVHGVLRNLSPVKRGKRANFFDGEMTDGACRIRFVGFKAEQRKKLEELSKGDNSVVIEDCQLVMSRQGHRMEALLKSSTSITESNKQFDLSQDCDGKIISLAEAKKNA